MQLFLCDLFNFSSTVVSYPSTAAFSAPRARSPTSALSPQHLSSYSFLAKASGSFSPMGTGGKEGKKGDKKGDGKHGAEEGKGASTYASSDKGKKRVAAAAGAAGRNLSTGATRLR